MFAAALKVDYLSRLKNAAGWLARAHYVTGEKGFSIGFDLRRGWLASYSETTGYIIPTLYRYSKMYNEPDYAKIATSAARWLVSIQSPEGWFPYYGGHAKRPYLRPPVVFDTAQDIFGLLSAYRETNESSFLEAAYLAGRWITQKQSPDGVWRNPGFGPAESASYYSRVTWPLQLLADATNDVEMAASAQRGLEAILSRVRPNYTVEFWGFDKDSPAFTHTIAYTIEGFLEHGLCIKNDAVVSTARNLAQATLDLLKKHNGHLAGAYDGDWRGNYRYICTPGNCQLALIYMRLFLISGEQYYVEGAEKVMAPVLAAQWISHWTPTFIRGALPGSWPPIAGEYMRWLYPNWAAKYLADAIMLRLHIQNGNSNENDQTLADLLTLLPG